MKINIIVVILLLFSGLVTSGSAQSKPDLLLLLRKKYSSEATIKTDIELKVWWQVREKEETKKGSLLLSASDRFRITLGNETYVSDGSTVYQYHSITKLLQIKHLKDVDRSMLPSHVMTSFIANYPLEETSRTDKETILSWSADSASSSAYKSIEVIADKKNCIRILKLTDNNGNVFTYTFTRTEFGGTVPKGAFEFEIPSDAQVNDAR
jgi:outer membrane lipoprotein-sorting protein